MLLHYLMWMEIVTHFDFIQIFITSKLALMFSKIGGVLLTYGWLRVSETNVKLVLHGEKVVGFLRIKAICIHEFTKKFPQLRLKLVDFLLDIGLGLLCIS